MANGKTGGNLTGGVWRLFWILGAIWTAAAAVSLLWNLRNREEHLLSIARANAELTYENDLIYRRWAARNGGVYVPVSGFSPPNPYLDVPDRDVITTGGLKLTLVNPAYMNRQANELAAESGTYRGHLTSLRPIRPQNAPDEWEAGALRSFENGAREASALDGSGETERLRYMRPFLTEKACLKCHAKQGYKEGDIRGGISVAVPTTPLREIEKPHSERVVLAHVLLWALGIMGLVVSGRGLVKETRAREAAQENQARAIEDLRVTNRDLSEFSYMASHDLKAPLRAIHSLSEILVNDFSGKLGDDGRRHLDLLASRVKRMHNLVDDVLEYSRIGRVAVNPTEVVVKGVIERAVQMVAPPAGVKVEMDVQIENVRADRAQIERVLQNLIGNAVKYMDKPAGVVRVGCEIRGGVPTFWVADNGPGIEPQDHERIFRMFETLRSKDEVESTGIGLAIVKRVVEGWGGRVWVESEVGVGSTFWFTLP